VKENITPAMYLIEHIITGKTAINMDNDGNGKNDVIENTRYDYKCDRSDLELPDFENNSEPDDSFEEPDDDLGSDKDKNDEMPDAFFDGDPSSGGGGCSFISGD
ncbi:MAG TPA: hypothetical protein P5044_00610, partial [bacterium]|nr:hypothetical protein [bacterium]